MLTFQAFLMKIERIKINFISCFSFVSKQKRLNGKWQHFCIKLFPLGHNDATSDPNINSWIKYPTLVDKYLHHICNLLYTEI